MLFSQEYSQQVYLMYAFFLSLFLPLLFSMVWYQLGNYLGALSNWVALQRDSLPSDELIFSVVGWHALTMPQKPKELAKSRAICTEAAWGYLGKEG